jgi:hypothetical protein
MNELVLPQSFPDNDYTPHGYIDNPYHTMVFNRSGILRSVPPLGFGYWLKRFRGTYGSGARGHVNYLSLMQVAVAVDDIRLATADDFATQRIRLGSKYHTKHMLSYDWMCAGLVFSLRYFLAREHALVCRVEVRNTLDTPKDIRFHVTNTYGLWDAPWWGSNGLAGRYVAEQDAAVSTIWAYGDYFALGSDLPSIAHKATGNAADWAAWLRDDNLDSCDGVSLHGPGPLHNVLSYRLNVPAHDSAGLLLCLARGPNEAWALDELETGLRQALPTLEQQLDEDESFWGSCPRLVGDWPELWKRGWVYDFETLRMNVRRPVGIFKHPWDAMQVHSPRSVLGEAAVDMLTLSYADPAVAKQVLLGTFVDAPAPNVPCTREDGSMNMIAADGHACGTAPSWCFPFHIIESLYAATGDDQWLTELYPYLKNYLEWWFANRTDAAGWFHCKCDWESGQDGSKRFPDVEGGAAETVRTVDVEAGVAEALRLMARFCELADVPEDRPYWTKLAEKRAAAVQRMFVDGWFYDIDSRTDSPIRLDYLDVMMLSPLTCRVATPEQVAALRPKFQHFRDHPQFWLEWPSFMLMLTEAAWTAGEHMLQAENIADIADRVYARTDARQLLHVDHAQPFTWRIPGVANEYWPLDENTEPGGECYGWGATLPLHLIRGIVGFRETETLPSPEDATRAAFILAPAIPARLATTGRRLGLTNLFFREVSFDITYEVLELNRLRVTLEFDADAPCRVEVIDRERGAVCDEAFEHANGSIVFDGLNGAVYTVRFTPNGA